MKKRLADQVVLVTGASSGLGRAVARGAGARGAKVVVTARNGEALDACVREIEAAGSEALAVAADCTVQDEVQQVVEQALDRFGRIDSYVANAIVTVYAETYRYRADELRRIVDVNFFGQVYGYWAALPHLRESRGTFVSINSALAYRGIPLQGGYCASKAALRAFFESARVEIEKAGWDVAVSVVLPGAINTPQFDRDRQKTGTQPQPVPPIYQPEPFAAGVLHCCEHPVRELPLGWGSQKALWGQKLSPRAGDLVLRRMGWTSQTTGEPKPLDAPDNLFAPMPGDPGAHGRFDDRSRGSTAWTSLRLALHSPKAALALLGAGAVAAGSAELLASRGRRPTRVG
ncbi:MAG: SDR family NAD(P)-dependent oxidoreductase [Acidobacteriota bacterium]|nr:SDR family NAD(P)-dependent oxidoreductase [Acidobacteriota bacterium]MDE3190985.1 SDR family NAD(P)-dependent oxidoreductase [Acidobacteriota bacterium]